MPSNVPFDGVEFDYIVLGAGPAGLQLGHHMATSGRSYLVLEAGDSPGSFFKTNPRHRRLISINKIHTGYDDPEVNLRHDWNSLLTDDDNPALRFPGNYSRKYFPSADDLVRYMADYASHYDLNIRYNARVLRVERRENGGFRLYDEAGQIYDCRWLLVATGISKPYVPDIPGAELAENYVDVSVDSEDFANQRVLILGKGNSGFEIAESLIDSTAFIHVASPNPLRLAWKTHYVGDLRAINNNFLDTYQLKSQNAVLDCRVDRIERRDGEFVVTVSYSHANGETEELTYDRVVICTGFRFDASIFAEDCRPELTLNGRFPVQTAEWESVNVPGLYFAGTLTQVSDYKRGTSGFIHGFRYNMRALCRMLEKKNFGRDWPSREIEPTPDGLVEATLERINRSSGLWQQFGFLHDVIVVGEDWEKALYYEEMPLAYVQQGEIGEKRRALTPCPLSQPALPVPRERGSPPTVLAELGTVRFRPSRQDPLSWWKGGRGRRGGQGVRVRAGESLSSLSDLWVTSTTRSQPSRNALR
jgi:thioredoxin reductase